MQMDIRFMAYSHLDDVLLIDQLGSPYPWPEERYLHHLRKLKHEGLIALQGNEALAVAIYHRSQQRLHLYKMVTHPNWRQLGVGSRLLEELKSKAIAYGLHRLTVNVPETNLPGLHFFKKRALKAVRVQWGFYRRSGEDAILMQHLLPKAMEGHNNGDLFINGMMQGTNRLLQYEDS